MNLGITLFFSLFMFLGTVIILITKDNKKIKELAISIAFSVLFLLIFLEIIPHTLEHLKFFEMIIYALIGFGILKLLDFFVPEHHHSNKKDHIKHIGKMSCFALVVHNLIEGMVLYSTLNKNLHVGILLGVGIGLHNIPMGIVIGSTLKDGKFSKTKVSLISLFISLATLFGALFISLFGPVSKYVMGIMFAIILGMLIYLVFFELLHHLKHQDNKNNITGFIIGAIIVWLSLMFHHH